MLRPKSILITGASSGIGAALARVYAAPGVTLALGGRDRARLDAVAETCRGLGAEVQAETVDVTDRDAMRAWVRRADAAESLDLAIANAGISGGTGRRGNMTTEPQGPEDADQVRRIFAVNVDGAINTVLPAIGVMQRHERTPGVREPATRGQIAIVSSLASFRGLPGAPAYCASKAAIRVWGEGLRCALAVEDISVSVVCPGFIRTPMTAGNPFPMPFLMDADEAAIRIRRGLAARRGRIVFPWPLYALIRLMNAFPVSWSDRLIGRLPEKPGSAR